MTSHPIDQMMEQAIERGVFPAASLLVGHHGDILHEGNYGEARGGVYFDVASLTKPVSTTTLAMQLVQEDLLHLDGDRAHGPERAPRDLHAARVQPLRLALEHQIDDLVE